MSICDKNKKEEVFSHMCKRGYLDDAKTLYEEHAKYGFENAEIDISANNEQAFRWACTNGHLEVAKWLWEIKPTIDITADDGYAFRGACTSCHVEVIKWLYKLYSENTNIIITRISMDIILAFMSACRKGHLEILKWILIEAPYRKENFYDKNYVDDHLKDYISDDGAFRIACDYGRLEVAKWVVEEFNPTIDISSNNNKAFINACKNGNLEIAEWLQSLRPDEYYITTTTKKIIDTYKVIR